MASIDERVTRAIRRLEAHPSFAIWRDEEKPAEGDLIVVNNSFVFRDVQTEKSARYLVAVIGRAGRLSVPPKVGRLASSQNVDFRLVTQKQTKPPLGDLRDTVEEERKRLGQLVFGLIGSVVDDRPVEVRLRGGPFERVVLNPKAGTPVVLADGSVVVASTDDEDALWTSIVDQARGRGIEVTENFKGDFAEALDRLQGLAVASLRLPPRDSPATPGILDAIVRALSGQLADYRTALGKYVRAQSDETRRAHFNEVLRVSYAFSNEACTLLRLIVSVCDLKPLILWATLDKHFHLSEVLRALPWTRSKRKPSLKGYVELVGDARNRAFHNVFPFEKALHFELPPGALAGAELRMFSEFGSKAHGNELTFHDKALADVMMAFTRARTRPTPDTFWEKN